MSELFLPGVPADHIRARLKAAGGNELDSGKLASEESSAALAVNAFGWFIERPDLLPPLLGLEHTGKASQVEVEYSARFPWSGGRHPWLDAAVTTDTHLIGVESKRYEPFRDKKTASFAEAYDRPVWGSNMERFNFVRDQLRSGVMRFKYLDAAQLVKHAYGLVTEARRQQKQPALFYLFAEPSERAGRKISPEDHRSHLEEIGRFAAAVLGDEVQFAFSSYHEWLATWGNASGVRVHADHLRRAFGL